EAVRVLLPSVTPPPILWDFLAHTSRLGLRPRQRHARGCSACRRLPSRDGPSRGRCPSLARYRRTVVGTAEKLGAALRISRLAPFAEIGPQASAGTPKRPAVELSWNCCSCQGPWCQCLLQWRDSGRSKSLIQQNSI